MEKAKKYLFDTHYHPEKPITLVRGEKKNRIKNFQGAINTVEDMNKAIEIAYYEGYLEGCGDALKSALDK